MFQADGSDVGGSFFFGNGQRPAGNGRVVSMRCANGSCTLHIVHSVHAVCFFFWFFPPSLSKAGSTWVHGRDFDQTAGTPDDQRVRNPGLSGKQCSLGLLNPESRASSATLDMPRFSLTRS